ncbi:MAG: NADPH-dependent FMN reductase [Gaiellales bacterium]
MTSILGISGSLRAGSLHSELLRLAAEELPGAATLTVWRRLGEVPPYDADAEDELPEPVAALVAAAGDADAVLIASPEYNGSVPGQLKNALDWLSRNASGLPLAGKPVLVIGGSTGQFGGVWAHGELRKVLGIVGARPLAEGLSVPRLDRALADEPAAVRAQLQPVLAALVEASVPTVA